MDSQKPYRMAAEHRKPTRRVPVLLPYPFPAPFDYSVPDALDPQPGDVVLVPLNRREEVGVVWDGPGDGAVPDRKLKPISGILDTPAMKEVQRRFVDWVAAYTLSPPGAVMAMALRVVTRAPATDRDHESPYESADKAFDDVARQLRSGTVGHNVWRSDFSIAFGGFKQSGIGREGGTEGLMPYLETKTIILEGTPAHLS